MLTVYRRHSADCKQTSRDSKRCNCPLWVEGTVEGRYLRQSLKARSWNRAQQLAREIEEGGKARISVKDAIKSFLDDARARGLVDSSIKKYDRLLTKLQNFTDEANKRHLSDLDVDSLRRFRESWKLKNHTARKELERLRTFYRFAQTSDWITQNPALLIKPPKVIHSPTLPFSKEEFARVLAACDKYPHRRFAVRLKALTMLLRYSGLRIMDAVCLERKRITDGVLSLRTAKTGTSVRIPLPPAAIAALEAVDASNEYFFWSGLGTRKAAVSIYQRSFKRLYKLAKVDDGHAHRWRDTFAVELLLAGVPLERVSVLLGHHSVRVTEKHYAPWVKARQDQTEADVRRTWQADDMAGARA
jgi:integrase/recombinase XerD